jgi:hypothetical protein
MPKNKADAATSKAPIILADPRDTDVLLGRGNGIANYPGNLMFRQTVCAHRQLYENAYRSEKQSVAKQVIDSISSLDPPGRFIELTKGGKYVLVPIEKVLEKTCQALREKKFKPPPKADALDTHKQLVAILPAKKKQKKVRKKYTTKNSATTNKKVTPPSGETKTQDAVCEKPTENAKKRAVVAVRSSKRVATSRKKKTKTSAEPEAPAIVDEPPLLFVALLLGHLRTHSCSTASGELSHGCRGDDTEEAPAAPDKIVGSRVEIPPTMHEKTEFYLGEAKAYSAKTSTTATMPTVNHPSTSPDSLVSPVLEYDQETKPSPRDSTFQHPLLTGLRILP